jgi:hypothetical protein
MPEQRHHCTCCNSKLFASKMIQMRYELLRRTFWHCQKCLSVISDKMHIVNHRKKKYLIELFSGSKIVSTIAAQQFGYKTLTIDHNDKLKPDIISDIKNLQLKSICRKKECSIIWASVPCTEMSILTAGIHWKKISKAHRQYVYMPRTEAAWSAVRLLEKTLYLIKQINPTFYFIENPRGIMRHLPQMLTIQYRHTVSYSDYGKSIYKPTDIFTNHPSLKLTNIKTAVGRTFPNSVNKMKNAYERSKVPNLLIYSILKQCQ